MADSKRCKTCRKLRREYAAVTAAQVGLDGEMSAAVRSSDPERFQTNAIALEAAEAPSIAAREAIRDHEAKVHSAPES
jgi:hypothetical protein